jgi:hypothetical protein
VGTAFTTKLPLPTKPDCRERACSRHVRLWHFPEELTRIDEVRSWTMSAALTRALIDAF